MFTPFDTAHMTHRAERHVPADTARREANRLIRATRRAALRAIVAQVFAAAPRHGEAEKPVNSRV